MGTRRVALAVLTACLLGVAAPARAAASAGITVVSDQGVTADPAASPDGRLHELTLQSAALGQETPVRVLLPPGYDDPAHAGKRYPVLFLLHGMTDNFSSWSDSERGFVASVIGDRELIVVMPDGGPYGWYSDWLGAGPKWETYHIDELVPWVDSYYRTTGTREQRAIAGYSMGGFGTMSYAARHPDLFVAAGSFSGAVDTTTTGPVEELFINAIGGADLGSTWGSFASNEIVWRDHNPADLAPNLKTTDLSFYVGQGLPSAQGFIFAGVFELALYKMNLSSHLKLQSHGVTHRYVEDPVGTHEFWFHQKNLARWLPILDALLANPQPRPASFTYRTAEPDFSVWRWDFHVDRAVKEFAEIHFDPATGLTVTGTGMMTVTTPPTFEPAAGYKVDGATSGGGVAAAAEGAPTVVADGAGRLTFSVDLGPSSATQQSTVNDLLGRTLRTQNVSIEKVNVVAPGPAPSPLPGGDEQPTAVSPVGGTRPSLPRTGEELPAAGVALLLAAALLGRRLSRLKPR